MTFEIINAEFVAWAKAEAERIARGESQPYHALLCDPPYGLEFMGKEWDKPHKAFADPKRATNLAYAKEHGCPGGNKGYSGIKGSSAFKAGGNFQAWVGQWASALVPLLYPGALVFCFGGTRTWHRLACGFEDAGYSIWDTLMWLHGQGFPKGQDISKLIDKKNGDAREVVGVRSGAGSSHTESLGEYQPKYLDSQPTVLSAPWSGHKTAALKPAWEPVLCFKAPTQGKSYADLALECGSGALNVDGGRIALLGHRAIESLPGNGSMTQSLNHTIPPGRYPANLAFECTCEETEIVDVHDSDPRRADGSVNHGGRGPYHASSSVAIEQGNHGGYGGKAIRHTDPNCPAFMLDAQAGFSSHSEHVCHVQPNDSIGTFKTKYRETFTHGDSGSASRFFYCGKATRSEREAGLRGELTSTRVFGEQGQGPLPQQSPRTARPVHNDHPTVKPLSLCRWLATLLLPPESVQPRRVLVPFAGCGSEVIAAMQAGWDVVVGIEQDAHYCDIARARLAHHAGPLFQGQVSGARSQGKRRVKAHPERPTAPGRARPAVVGAGVGAPSAPLSGHEL